MSQTSMASISSSSSTSTFNNNKKFDIESIRLFVISVNQHILRLLEDPESRRLLQLRCTSKLKIQKQKFFEFSEHSVLSNLYWGIESVEAAIQAKWSEERTSRLKNSARMLQAPALLDEHGTTGGIQNRYLVCCSYFYLSLVRKLQMDEWQVALHFLQAMLVHPRLVRMEFTPELWEKVFLSQIMSGWKKGFLKEPCVGSYNGKIDEAARQIARRYKDWLMYYQITVHGETPKWNWGSRVAPMMDEESQSFTYTTSSSTEYVDSVETGNIWPKFQDGEKVHPLDLQDGIIDEIKDGANNCIDISKQKNTFIQDAGKGLLKKDDEVYGKDAKENLQIKCLQDMLQDSQSDTTDSVYSFNDSTEGSDLEEMDDKESLSRIEIVEADEGYSEISHGELQMACIQDPEHRQIASAESTRCPVGKEGDGVNNSYFFSNRFLGCVSEINLPILELKDICPNNISNRQVDGTTQRRSELQSFSLFDHISSQSLKKNSITHMNQWGSSASKRHDSNIKKRSFGTNLEAEKDLQIEVMEVFRKAVATLCFSEKPDKSEDVSGEVSIMWEVLNNKKEARYGLLKDEILDQLLNAISTSQEERVLRASVSVLTTLISENKTVVEEIKRRGLRLSDLASALKRNVHEAAILIYLINPSPTEVKSLGLLPALLDVVCNSKGGVPISLWLTPLAASLMMIEVLVTSFDYTTNNTHLAVISSPPVLSQLLNAARNKNLGEIISLASILTKCMQFDGQCKKFLCQVTPMAPFVCLLRSKEKCAKITALQFFHEILRMPRLSVINLLHQIREPDGINIMHTLMSCIQQLELEHRILASNLLFQLDMLEDSSSRSVFREEATEILLEALASEESSEAQILSASILSNIGGTYAWTGESYTAAWLVQKAGLTSAKDKNMIRSFDWLDESLQDGSIGVWCSRVARSIIKIGSPVFRVLEKGLQSKTKSVSKNSLIAIAWIGCEITKKSPGNLRYSACEILLSGIQKFLHPGLELEERLLACLSIYNYAAGKGMQKLIHFSEGVRESLRRLSSITWMAEELVKVTEYFLPTKSRVSCVHTQILEASHSSGGAASALIYYKGQLYSGHSDGSIKVWDINGQTSSLVWNVHEHKKAVTCFAIYEPGDSLLSGSTDKTIQIWRLVRGRLEQVEVIETKEAVQKLDSYGHYIFAIMQNRGIKVFNTSRAIKCICKTKHVKSMTVDQGKIYVGCTDSSIQEVNVKTDREKEIKAPAKSWRMQNKPINSLIAYKEWLYTASVTVGGSTFKEWRRRNEAQMSISIGKGSSVQAMEVVEDFIYLICSSAPNIIEIWLRGMQKKVGRLSAGSKITSLLTANDIVLCGTEAGLIKGWIPL